MSRDWALERSAGNQGYFSHFPAQKSESNRLQPATIPVTASPSSLYLFTKEDFVRMGHQLDKLTDQNQELKDKLLRLEGELLHFQSQQFQQSLGRSSTPQKSKLSSPLKAFSVPSPRKVISTLATSSVPAEGEVNPGGEAQLDGTAAHVGLDSLKALSEQRLREYIRVLESYILTLDIHAQPHPPELRYLLEGRRVQNKHIDMAGKEYVGQALAGKPSGHGKLCSPGHIIEGEFLNGKPHGKVLVTRDEYREKCRFVYGTKQGYYEKAYRNGGFESGCLVDGLSQGPKKFVHSDGSLEYLSMHAGSVVGVSIKLSRDKTQIEVVDRTGSHLIRHTYKKKLQQ